MPTIDQNADKFARNLEAIKKATVDHVYKLGDGLSRQEMTVLIDRLDFTALVNDLGYTKSVDELMASYKGVLQGLEGIAPVSETVLQALANTDKAFYLGKGTDLANTIKQELTRGALQGLSRETMKAAIADVTGFSAPQVRTIIDTAMRTFSRDVGVAMSENLPANTLYFYAGPADIKTRDICLAMLSAGNLTTAQIDSQFPGSRSSGGGHNCRHNWARVSDLSHKFSKQKEAEQLIKDNPPKTKPQTPLEKSLDAAS